MAKESIYNRGSVKEGGNAVVCQSRFHAPTHARAGSYIRFYGDNEMYQIAKMEPFFCILDFETIISDRVFVKNEDAMGLVAGDLVEISYKEYELSTSINIMNGGEGYLKGDTFTVDDGVPAEDVISAEKSHAIIEVIEVDKDGCVEKVKVSDRGKYWESPPEQVSLGWEPKGGSGKGAELALVYKTTDYRSAMTREVTLLEVAEGGWRVIFSSSLPPNVLGGKLSCKKHKLILNSTYVSMTKWTEHFQLIVDFTPNCGVPLMLENSLSVPLVYNKAMIVLDKKISMLEKEIKSLKEKAD